MRGLGADWVRNSTSHSRDVACGGERGGQALRVARRPQKVFGPAVWSRCQIRTARTIGCRSRVGGTRLRNGGCATGRATRPTAQRTQEEPPSERLRRRPARAFTRLPSLRGLSRWNL